MNRYPSILDDILQQVLAVEDELARPEYQPDAMRDMRLKDAYTIVGKLSDSLDNIQRACDECRHIINNYYVYCWIVVIDIPVDIVSSCSLKVGGSCC